MTALLLGARAGALVSAAVVWLGYRALGWWREVPLDGDDFRLTPREWDQIHAPDPADHRRPTTNRPSRPANCCSATRASSPG